MKTYLYGIINIGASAFRMSVSEVSSKGIKEIEYLIKPLRLGVDTFSQGYISLEHVKQATEILCGFRNKLVEYGIKEYKAVCTSGVREALNKDFFIDYVKIHAGIDIIILEPSEEVYIKYLAAKLSVANFDKMEKQGVVFANIASGNITLSVTKGDNILYSGALPYGSLRLRQMFRHIAPSKRHRAFDQYAENMVSTVAGTINNVKVKNLVGSGSSINMMLRIFKPSDDFILRDDLEKLYSKIRAYTKQDIVEELSLRDDEAEVLVPTLCTYIHLLKYTGADRFHFSPVDFPSTLTHFYAGFLKDKNYQKRIKQTILSFGERFNINVAHAKRVSKFSKKLFNEFCDLHSLDKSKFDILETASLLYQVGGYIDPRNVTYNSYYIIKSINIPGWSSKDIQMTACVINSMDINKTNDEKKQSQTLSSEERLVVNKLACILRMAYALDGSKSGLIDDIDIIQNDNIILINAQVKKEPFVELFTFDKIKHTFEETFGIPIDIRTNMVYD